MNTLLLQTPIWNIICPFLLRFFAENFFYYTISCIISITFLSFIYLFFLEYGFELNIPQL